MDVEEQKKVRLGGWGVEGGAQGMSEETLLLQEAALQENRSSRFTERNL